MKNRIEEYSTLDAVSDGRCKATVSRTSGKLEPEVNIALPAQDWALVALELAGQVATLEARIQANITGCVYCGGKWASATDIVVAKEQARAHAQTCPHNPLVIRVAELEEKLRRMATGRKAKRSTHV